MPAVLPSSPPATGLLRYEWLDPTGVLRDLSLATSPTMFVSRGAAGLGMPPVEPVLEKLPFTAGSLLRYTQVQPLEIELPITLLAASMGALMTAQAFLRAWFATGDERTRAPGYLRITRPSDDAVRQVACYYTGGLEGDLSTGSPSNTTVVVSLVAPDPYWTDTSPSTTTYLQANIGSSLGVLNPGDFDAFPIWTITGPASAITITNATTGKVLSLTANGGLALTGSDTLVIDTRPASARTALPVLLNGTVSRFDRLSSGSALWWLVPGSNTFTVVATGATAGTSIVLSRLPRYRGVLR